MERDLPTRADVPAKNWAGNVTYQASARLTPTSVAELSEAVTAHERVKAVGTRHSFNDAADTDADGVQVSLEAMPDDVRLDPGTGVVSAPGGLTHAQLAAVLHEQGRALPNLASLPHISVAGAVQTGTHGSGVGNPALSSQVVAVELVDADGVAQRVARGDDDFAAVSVGLGAFGVVHRVELATVPAFEVESRVFEGLTWEALLPRWDDVLGGGYSVSLFTRYDTDEVEQVWVKRVPGGAGGDAVEVLAGLGAREAAEPLHMLPGMPVENLTPQLGSHGPWHERLPHFRSDFLPSAGEEIQAEYLLPAEAAADAVAAMRALAPVVAPLLHVSELRRVAADEAWLSPSSGRDSLAVHFTFKLDVDAVAAVLPDVEAALLPLGARPHWGKAFACDATALRAAYPRFDDFRAVLARRDPRGRFENPYLRRVLGPR
ncbi:alditol oxidase [Nocardioides marinquilinus]|uniref:Alditol oxidase n=1 Tax=Nocardioides marinquilinus TaxID=1210400 RepID=A0ABP9PBQ4_9ACTN